MTTVHVFKGTLIVLLTLMAAYILLISARILVVLLIAIIIASAVRPMIVGLTKRRVPQGLAILLIYATLAAGILLLTVAIVPPIVNQVAFYIENDNRLAARIIQAQYWVEHIISDVTGSETSLVAAEEIRDAVSDFMREFRRIMPSMVDDMSATLGDAVLMFVMGAYWLTSHEKATAFMTQLVPSRYRDQAQSIVDQIEATMGGYVRGITLIALIVGTLNFMVMLLLNVPNPFTLAFIIGLSTLIPMLGGLLGIGLAAVLTLMTTPPYVLGVVVIALVIQQIEAYFLSPRIMSDRVGLDPLLVIVYTTIGFVLSGVVGALIAVPFMSMVHILLVYLVIEPYKKSLRKLQTEDGLPVIKIDAPVEKLILPVSNNCKKY